MAGPPGTPTCRRSVDRACRAATTASELTIVSDGIAACTRPARDRPGGRRAGGVPGGGGLAATSARPGQGGTWIVRWHRRARSVRREERRAERSTSAGGPTAAAKTSGSGPNAQRSALEQPRQRETPLAYYGGFQSELAERLGAARYDGRMFAGPRLRLDDTESEGSTPRSRADRGLAPDALPDDEVGASCCTPEEAREEPARAEVSDGMATAGGPTPPESAADLDVARVAVERRRLGRTDAPASGARDGGAGRRCARAPGARLNDLDDARAALRQRPQRRSADPARTVDLAVGDGRPPSSTTVRRCSSSTDGAGSAGKTRDLGVDGGAACPRIFDGAGARTWFPSRRRSVRSCSSPSTGGRRPTRIGDPVVACAVSAEATRTAELAVDGVRRARRGGGSRCVSPRAAQRGAGSSRLPGGGRSGTTPA
jgi:hypothetical protein